MDIHLKQMNFWIRKCYRRIIQLFGSHLYINPDQDVHKSILVAGTARSGTVWLADLIASQVPCRFMFEPFNPDLVPDYRDFHYFQYMRPGCEEKKLCTFANKIFGGEVRNSWIDHRNERIISKYRLIKEIRANLMLKWLHDNFPEVPIVFLIRHPCAVVLSRMQLGWATDRDIEPFMAQPNLIADHLAPYIDMIENAETDEEKHAIIWSVSYLVPLEQFQPVELKIVYYENLCTQPEIELPSIFKAIGQQSQSFAFNRIVDRPSQTSQGTSAVVIGTDKVENWKKRLSSVQIDNILRIVDAFGLSHLYGDSFLPLGKDVT